MWSFVFECIVKIRGMYQIHTDSQWVGGSSFRTSHMSFLFLGKDVWSCCRLVMKRKSLYHVYYYLSLSLYYWTHNVKIEVSGTCQIFVLSKMGLPC